MTDPAEGMSFKDGVFVKKGCDHDDWVRLKETFSSVHQLYEADDPRTSVHLRAVIRECHRFLLHYQDPSVIFKSAPRDMASTLTPPEERLKRDWGHEAPKSPKSPEVVRPTKPPPPPPPPPPSECPSAFHTLFGISLFLLGDIISRTPSLARSDEPMDALHYWLAALDVFATADTLAGAGSTVDATVVDWHLMAGWGRTLVALAHAKAARELPASAFKEPTWPRDSVLRQLAVRRPPTCVSERAALAKASAGEVMTIAADQLACAWLHMPHSPGATLRPLPKGMLSVADLMPDGPRFSRPRALFVMASVVGELAAALSDPADRQRWARWADSVYEKIHVPADQASDVALARARCLIAAHDLEKAREFLDEAKRAGKEEEEVEKLWVKAQART